MSKKQEKRPLLFIFIIHVSLNFHALYILPAFGLNNEGPDHKMFPEIVLGILASATNY